jgi:transketolase
MQIPITIVGMGTGLSYSSDGPTHHLLEDIAVLRSFPNMNIYNITDAVMAKEIVDLVYTQKGTNYIRLDKDKYPEVYDINYDFSNGLRQLHNCVEETLIITSGVMSHTAIEVATKLKENGVSVGVIDVYQIPINKPLLLNTIRNSKRLITLEEHFLAGGLGSAICEILCDECIFIPLLRIGMSMQDGYKFTYKYGGRNIIQQHYGIDSQSVKEKIMIFLQTGGHYETK